MVVILKMLTNITITEVRYFGKFKLHKIGMIVYFFNHYKWLIGPWARMS